MGHLNGTFATIDALLARHRPGRRSGLPAPGLGRPARGAELEATLWASRQKLGVCLALLQLAGDVRDGGSGDDSAEEIDRGKV
jgi:hypothetical protein